MTQMNIATALDRDFMNAGHSGCPGCGGTIAMKFALKALGEKTMMVMPASCWAILAGPYPQTALKVPVMQIAFAGAGAAASGLRAALDARGEDETVVVAWAGDGGTFDIGLQSLSGAAERNEDFIYVCYDNEAYMNTGVQRSSSTPYGMRTTTTPGDEWKKTGKKNIMEAMAAHRIPYAATANIAFPDDLFRKFNKAKDLKGGTRFLHVFATCPTGWRIPSETGIKVARLATETNVFPLYEVIDGVRYVLNHEGTRPVKEYMSEQGRFKHLTEADYNKIQHLIDDDWKRLRRKAGKTT